MNIHDIRTLNLVGTILLLIFGIIIPIIYLFWFGFIFWMARPDGIYISLCLIILFVWIMVVAFFGFKIYQNSVLGIDREDFQTAKNWTLYGAIIGFIFGGFNWIILIIFLISYLCFDDALYPKHYYYPPPYYPYPPQYPYGPIHSLQYPIPSYPCTTCGSKLRFINENGRWYCDKCKKYF